MPPYYIHAQGQFIQTLLSEKVEAGVPATGRRFALDGIFTPQGVRIPMTRFPEREAIAFMATSMMLPVRHPPPPFLPASYHDV
jgi:hypothetical protein